MAEKDGECVLATSWNAAIRSPNLGVRTVILEYWNVINVRDVFANFATARHSTRKDLFFHHSRKVHSCPSILRFDWLSQSIPEDHRMLDATRHDQLT